VKAEIKNNSMKSRKRALSWLKENVLILKVLISTNNTVG
jgi:hypothetical protein